MHPAVALSSVSFHPELRGELCEQMAHMYVGGAGAHEQPGGALPVAASRAEQAQHLLLPAGETGWLEGAGAELPAGIQLGASAELGPSHMAP